MRERNHNYSNYDCSDRDVVAFGDSMFRAGKLKDSIIDTFDINVGKSIEQKLRLNGIELPVRMLSPNHVSATTNSWFEEGLDCEILSLEKQGWAKGKIRVKVEVEFYLEEEVATLSEPENNRALLPSRAEIEDLPTADFELTGMPVSPSLTPVHSLKNGDSNGNGNGKMRHSA
jgi:hypothetical protein